jgi:hypothetical protein
LPKSLGAPLTIALDRSPPEQATIGHLGTDKKDTITGPNLYLPACVRLALGELPLGLHSVLGSSLVKPASGGCLTPCASERAQHGSGSRRGQPSALPPPRRDSQSLITSSTVAIRLEIHPLGLWISTTDRRMDGAHLMSPMSRRRAPGLPGREPIPQFL